MSRVPSVVAQPQSVGSDRFLIHPGLAPVVLSGLAVGVLQVSLYHLLLPFVGVDVYAFLLSTGLFSLGYSLTAPDAVPDLPGPEVCRGSQEASDLGHGSRSAGACSRRLGVYGGAER